jgi:type II secretory pathway pseudopilin PulG
LSPAPGRAFVFTLVQKIPSPSARRLFRRTLAVRGITILGLAVTLVLICGVANLAVPLVGNIRRESRASAVAADLREFAAAFKSYAQTRGDWPAPEAAPGVIPAGMETSLRGTNWAQVTPLGGRYTWAPNTMQRGERIRAAIVITPDQQHPVSPDRRQLAALDRTLDDGTFDTGQFRLGFRNHPLFVLEH